MSRRVFFDIDTQYDFVNPSGALYVPGSERLLPVIAQLNRHAATQGIPVISTMDAHAEDDIEFRQWPSHCVAGTLGQQKAPVTLLDSRVVVSTSPHRPEVAGAAQIIVEKQELDCFSNPNLPAVIDALEAEEFVVYGVYTEYCVHCAVTGLLGLGKPVIVVRDAIQTLDPKEEERVQSQWQASGARWATSREIRGD
jgi:nicotinamidase/pyrazinamidase